MASAEVPIRKLAGTVRVTQTLLDDWRPPPRMRFPTIVLLPRLAAATQWLDIARRRAGEALDVLLHGLPEIDR